MELQKGMQTSPSARSTRSGHEGCSTLSQAVPRSLNYESPAPSMVVNVQGYRKSEMSDRPTRTSVRTDVSLGYAANLRATVFIFLAKRLA
jgi:hypothetical protein